MSSPDAAVSSAAVKVRECVHRAEWLAALAAPLLLPPADWVQSPCGGAVYWHTAPDGGHAGLCSAGPTGALQLWIVGFGAVHGPLKSGSLCTYPIAACTWHDILCSDVTMALTWVQHLPGLQGVAVGWVSNLAW